MSHEEDHAPIFCFRKWAHHGYSGRVTATDSLVVLIKDVLAVLGCCWGAQQYLQRVTP